MTKPRVVAVICAYWPERLDNIRKIVSDLQAGSVVPDRILVLNNNKDVSLSIEGADIINHVERQRHPVRF